MSTALQTGYEELPAESARRLDEACDRLEKAWRSGQRPALEAYLGDVSGADRLVFVRELILVDAPYRRRAGEVPRPEDYLARFPELDGAWLAQVLAAPAGERTLPRVGHEARVSPPAVPGYEVMEELGRGGMGVVFKARDTRLGRLVALKVLAPEAAHNPRLLERFRREARAACALNHPAVCTLHDLGEDQGRPALVLEYVEGQTLRGLSSTCPDLPGLLPLFRQVAEALAVAHAAGIVHRDIKPENLMVRPDGYVKVLDFGLARLLPEQAGPAGADTDPGTLLGTLCYMSPEQTRGELAGSATDIFSLGVVLYELVTGRHPFDTGAELGTLYAIAFQKPPAPRQVNPAIPAPLGALIQRMLEKEPAARPTAAEVEAALAELLRGSACGRPAAAGSAAPARRPTVGREPERAALRSALDGALAGSGVLLCLTGEPGIGKTTLVEEFLHELTDAGRACCVGQGRCSERLGGAGAYLPMLEALEGLLRGEAGTQASQRMRTLAPTWYVQVAPRREEDAARLAAQASSQERMKREFLAFVEEMARVQPVVLFLDDLHWADDSTVDLLAYLGGRITGLRVLVLATYRPTEMLHGEHPFVSVQLELQQHGACREVSLGLLSAADVEGYLALAFPGHGFGADLATDLHARTGGNPLFLVELLGHLRELGVIAQRGDGWTLARPLPDFQQELPVSVRSLIQSKLDLLGEADRRLLSAASVQGQEFDSAVVARVLGLAAAEVEEGLAALDRVHGLVRLRREHEFPDGTLSLRYQFVHTLYQNALYAPLPPTRKRDWSAATAQTLLAYHGGQSAAVAADLALLFEAARDWARAADHFHAAAQNALRVHAHAQAVSLARRGLSLLPRLADTPERARLELRLRVTLGTPLQATQGFAAPEVVETYSRARKLCEQTGGTVELSPILWGLWAFHAVRAEHRTALELAEQLLVRARATQDPVMFLPAHHALGFTLMQLGDLAAAWSYLEHDPSSQEPQPGRSCALYGRDLRISFRGHGAVALCLLGYPDQAVARGHEAVTLAREAGDLPGLASTLYSVTCIHQFRGEEQATQQHAEALVACAALHAFALWLGV